MKQFTILLILASILVACNKQIDAIRPLTKIDQQGELSSVAGILEATAGNYLYLGGRDRLFYDLVRQDLGENRGNNVTRQDWGPETQYTDAFSFRNSTTIGAGSNSDFYKGSYQIITSANACLEGITSFKASGFAALTEADKNKVLHAEGENRFLRAFTYFNLVNVYGKPYYQAGTQDLSVALKKTASMSDAPARAPVKEVFDFIVSELEMAAQLMKVPVVKKNSFATTAAAWALLSRVYLYMGGSINSPDATANQMAVKYADSVILQTNGAYTLLQGSAYQAMFGDDLSGALGKSVFAGNKEIIFGLDNATIGGSPVGLLYHYHEDIGMGAIFLPSSELLSLFTPADLRSGFFVKNAFTGRIESTKWLSLNRGGVTYAPSIYFRLGEIYLNRAEAYAKLNNTAMAKADLKMIHQRSGLAASEVDNIPAAEVLAAVLKERRMELAFEGHNSFDYFRNGLPMSRSAADNNGVPLLVQPTDAKVVFEVPNI